MKIQKAMDLKLYMILLGANPPGRFIEQHDIFFGIGSSLKELVPAMREFWPEAKSTLHIDAWREVTLVDGFRVHVQEKGLTEKNSVETNSVKLFFLNLGGYREGELEEFHYKMVVASETVSEAIKKARQTAFYKHFGLKGAPSHIDEKFGLDVDDLYKVADILPTQMLENYELVLQPVDELSEPDVLHLEYLLLGKIK